MRESVFSRLISYPPTRNLIPKENFLTELFAWLLENIKGYCKTYIDYLCKEGKIEQPDENDMYVEVQTQVSISSGYIDMLIKVNKDLNFICEHKVNSSLGQDQLAKYLSNSDELNVGKCYIVLLTKSKTQHTQNADIPIIWEDVYKLTKDHIKDYDNEESFLLWQFLDFLTEQRLCEIMISNETLKYYWDSMRIENYYARIFEELAGEDWSVLCPGLDNSRMLQEFKPKYSPKRWGRIGIDFSTVWNPNIFAGVLFDTNDHKLPPIDIKKGPELVIFVESDYDKRGNDNERYRNNSASAKIWWSNIQKINDHHDFNVQPGIKKSRWRLIVLRKPLFDVIEGADTRDGQKEQIKESIQQAINLLLEAEQLSKQSEI